MRSLYSQLWLRSSRRSFYAQWLVFECMRKPLQGWGKIRLLCSYSSTLAGFLLNHRLMDKEIRREGRAGANILRSFNQISSIHSSGPVWAVHPEGHGQGRLVQLGHLLQILFHTTVRILYCQKIRWCSSWLQTCTRHVDWARAPWSTINKWLRPRQWLAECCLRLYKGGGGKMNKCYPPIPPGMVIRYCIADDL